MTTAASSRELFLRACEVVWSEYAQDLRLDDTADVDSALCAVIRLAMQKDDDSGGVCLTPSSSLLVNLRTVAPLPISLACCIEHGADPGPALSDLADNKWRQEICVVGARLDALDTEGKWYCAQVFSVCHTNGADHPIKLLLVHYDGWNSNWDEWLISSSYRLLPHGVHYRLPPGKFLRLHRDLMSDQSTEPAVAAGLVRFDQRRSLIRQALQPVLCASLAGLCLQYLFGQRGT